MKFQIPSMHHSEVNRRTDRQSDRQTDKPKAICPSNFFKVGGIITKILHGQVFVMIVFSVRILLGLHYIALLLLASITYNLDISTFIGYTSYGNFAKKKLMGVTLYFGKLMCLAIRLSTSGI